MPMLWREWNAEAKARGYYNDADERRWLSVYTCPAAEIVKNCSGLTYGEIGLRIEENPYAPERVWLHIWDMGNSLLGDMTAKDFDGFDRKLDLMEDRALEIKRSLGA